MSRTVRALLNAVLTISLLLPYQIFALSCFDKATTPSVYFPFINDCILLASGLRALPKASEYVAMSAYPLPLGVKPIQIPQAWYYGTCFVDVSTDGPPWYDITRYIDIAQIVNEAADECLDVISERKNGGYGGVERAGGNNFLVVSVTGYVNEVIKTPVRVFENSTQSLGLGNATTIQSVKVERALERNTNTKQGIAKSWNG